MAGFNDPEGKAVASKICEIRNKHILKTHPLRWKPLWDQHRGWFPALCPIGEGVTSHVAAQ